MKKILQLISSPNGPASFSTRLSGAIVEKLQARYPDSTLITCDLTHQSFPHVESSQIAAFFTPSEFRTEEHKNAIRYSDKLVNELMEADILVIGVPMHNFTIPSTLKAWIDHIVRAGITFRFTANGAEGLVRNKKAFLAIATGNVYSVGEMKNYDFTESYLRAILGFIGITDVTVARAEGTAIPGMQEAALQKDLDSIAV